MRFGGKYVMTNHGVALSGCCRLRWLIQDQEHLRVRRRSQRTPTPWRGERLRDRHRHTRTSLGLLGDGKDQPQENHIPLPGRSWQVISPTATRFFVSNLQASLTSCLSGQDITYTYGDKSNHLRGNIEYFSRFNPGLPLIVGLFDSWPRYTQATLFFHSRQTSKYSIALCLVMPGFFWTFFRNNFQLRVGETLSFSQDSCSFCKITLSFCKITVGWDCDLVAVLLNGPATFTESELKTA